MSLLPLAEGIVATLIAAIVIAAWLAIGSAAVGRRFLENPSAPPVALIVGSGLTSFALALFSWAGQVRIGVGAVSIVSLAALFIFRRRVLTLCSMIVTPYRDIPGTAVMKIAFAVTIGVAWLSAMSPPRSADAMRYHLAHIRQIVSEGRWVAIADYHYALPFGWTLSYLPFEMLGLPQGAQLLGFGLFVVVVSASARTLMMSKVSTAAAFVSLLLFLHPAVLRVFSEAGADAYALLVILAVATGLMSVRKSGVREIAVLGFVTWIGLGSRYQLVAVGIAATVVLLVSHGYKDGKKKALIAYAVGSTVALVLASPFYLTNLAAFGNPVWPLMISKSAATASYANAMAYAYTESLTGSYSPLAIANSLWVLVTTRFLVPLSLVIVVMIFLAIRSKREEGRTLGIFGTFFFLLWLVMAPLLYPRFVLLLLPVAVLACGFILESWASAGTSRTVKLQFASRWVAALLAVSSIIVFKDNLRYIATGDVREYHRFTWFYPVYEWMNRETPANARVLVILSSGHTYYLNRPYRRADPWISGVVSWTSIPTGRALDELLDREGYTYVLYEDRDWHWFPGGAEMQKVVREAVTSGLLVPERRFDERLYRSRIDRRFTRASIYVLRNH